MYAFREIVINNKTVSIDALCSGITIGDTAFETSTFNFIKDWLAGVDNFVINTSGSTGESKPIVLTRSQMKHSASLTAQALGLMRGDAALVCLNTQYIAGKMMLVRSLETGMKIIAVEPSSNPLTPISEKIDFTALVPFQLEKIMEAGQEYISQLDAMKSILVGGAAVSDALQEVIQKIMTPVYATYGMTETISHIALKRLNGKESTPYFQVLPGVEIQQDERNCLVVQAPYLSEKIITNDVVDIRDGNRFQWLGRWDNVINTGGIKVMPEKTELTIGKIFSHFGIQQNFFVYGLADKSLGSKIILVVEGEEFSKKNDVLKNIYQTLPKYEAPKEMNFIPTFSYTETGKINRKKTLKLT